MSKSPLNPYIREASSTNTATGYYAEDRVDPDFFIEASVTQINGEKVLSFVVQALKMCLSGAIIRGRIKGIDFFDTMWDHFQLLGTHIDVIQGEWSDAPLIGNVSFTTNLDSFNKAVLVYSTLDEAALEDTVTGKYAKKYGYSKVSISQVHGQRGVYTHVVVQFRRP
jgi:hypothetical protein